ncbi:MAG TPA: L-histidine N(alpha)-methyltransferase [Pyrinomonadaceae bacterium]|nr:L-histidine N(alpha)-methyltransferase [Pyrinomonadaceae bacterium]
MSQPQPSSRRFVVHDLKKQKGHADFARDVRDGLSAKPKQLFPKFLYDALGSKLFEAICQVEEYYPTRAETEILTRHSDEIVSSVPDCQTLIELGSGSAEKTRRVIEALLRIQPTLLFVPIDISPSALEESSHTLLQAYPTLQIEAYAADYFDGLAALKPPAHGRALVLFLGSNIGNFEKPDASTFLRTIRRGLRPGDALLLGADLKKDRETLERAYNDSLGVTRAFILNQLARINREFGADFDLWAFGLRSVYNDAEGRIDVYLESLRQQSVTIPGLDLSFTLEAGERIHMENAYKYDLEELSSLAQQTGFVREQTWFDEAKRFSSNLFVAVE